MSIWHRYLIGTSFTVPNDLRLTCNAHEANGFRSEQEQPQQGEDRESDATEKLVKQRISFIRSSCAYKQPSLADVTKSEVQEDVRQGD